MIQNVFLDLDDTLLDFHMAERAALTKTLLHFGLAPTEETLLQYGELNRAQWRLLERRSITREELKVRRYRLLFDALGVDCSAEEAAACYENFLSIGHYFINGAEALLENLVQSYRLYLASNGFIGIQTGRLNSAGIAKYFSKIFISQQIGFDKPAREFFDACFLQIPNFKKEETVIVGDSLTSDVLGGKNAGIATVWFNPNACGNATDIVADYEIRALSELPALLSRIR